MGVARLAIIRRMGIWSAAAIATVLAPAILIWPIRRLSAPGDRRVLLLGALLALPLQPLAFHAIPMPLHHALEAMLGPGPVLGTLSLFYAPLSDGSVAFASGNTLQTLSMNGSSTARSK